jgi:hypothetical protein
MFRMFADVQTGDALNLPRPSGRRQATNCGGSLANNATALLCWVSV